MVLAELWTQYLLRRAVERHQQRGEEWTRRREEATTKGELFIEPPPSLDKRR